MVELTVATHNFVIHDNTVLPGVTEMKLEVHLNID